MSEKYRNGIRMRYTKVAGMVLLILIVVAVEAYSLWVLSRINIVLILIPISLGAVAILFAACAIDDWEG